MLSLIHNLADFLAAKHVDERFRTFEELIDLAGALDGMLHRMRSERHIRTPIIRCRKCDTKDPPRNQT